MTIIVFKFHFWLCQKLIVIQSKIKESKAFNGNQFKVKAKMIKSCPNLLMTFGRM